MSGPENIYGKSVQVDAGLLFRVLKDPRAWRCSLVHELEPLIEEYRNKPLTEEELAEKEKEEQLKTLFKGFLRNSSDRFDKLLFEALSREDI